MSDGKLTLLLDTNVWVDYYLPNRPAHKDAKALISLAENEGLTLTYASVSIKDVFYLLNQELKKYAREDRGVLQEGDAVACQRIAWGCIRNMTQQAVALPVGEPQVWLASRLEEIHGDFEDDLVLAALETSGANFLVTSDVALREKAPKGAYDTVGMLTYLRAIDEA